MKRLYKDKKRNAEARSLHDTEMLWCRYNFMEMDENTFGWYLRSLIFADRHTFYFHEWYRVRYTFEFTDRVRLETRLIKNKELLTLSKEIAPLHISLWGENDNAE